MLHQLTMSALCLKEDQIIEFKLARKYNEIYFLLNQQ